MKIPPEILQRIDPVRDAGRSLGDITADLMDKAFLGLHVIAPAQVPPTTEHVPVIGFLGRREGQDGDLEGTAVVVACRLESNEVFAARIYPEEDRPVRAPEPPLRVDTVLDPESTFCRQLSFDLRACLPNLPHVAGTIAAAVLAAGDRSNDLHIAFSSGVGSDDTAVQEALARRRRPGYPAPPWPPRRAGHTHPKYRYELGCPPLPETPGIALATEPGVVIGRESSYCLLRGSFMLRALRREIVRPLAEADAKDQYPGSPLLWRDVGDSDAKAVVAITLVITGQRELGPWVIPLHVPVYELLSEEERPIVKGHFVFNLFALPGMSRHAQPHRIWAFSGGVIGGPARFTFLDEIEAPRLGDG